MQPPSDKQHVRAQLHTGLWLTGQYFERHPQLGGEPGYSLVIGSLNGRPFAGPYYADRVVEWCANPFRGVNDVEGEAIDAILAAKEDDRQLSLFK